LENYLLGILSTAMILLLYMQVTDRL